MPEIASTGGSFGSTLTGVANLAQLFLPTNQNSTQTTTDNRSSTTSTSGSTNTTTTSRNVSQDAINATVKSILEGTSGLAAISGGERNAGLFNSSTNQLLNNDLIARAAAEGAKLNETTTTTQNVGPTSQTTVNSGGQTTATTQQRQAQVRPQTAIGALALLQAVPKSVKDSVLSGLLGGGKQTTAAGGSIPSSETQSAIEAAYNDPSRSLDIVPGSSVGENAASVAGIGASGTQDISGISADVAAGTAADAGASSIGGIGAMLGGGDEDTLGNFLSSNNIVASTGDYLNELGSGVGDALGGFGDAMSGYVDDLGASVGNVASSVGDWFSDFDFSFADGGKVSNDSKRDQILAHFTKKAEDYISNNGRMSQMGGVPPPAFADGGKADIWSQTRARNERAAGLRPTEDQTQVLQAGNVPRIPVEQQPLSSIFTQIPALVRAVLGNTQNPLVEDVKAKGYADGGRIRAPGYANGGTINRDNPAYDLDTRTAGYLANTGLRPGMQQQVTTGVADSNDQLLNRMIRDQIRGPATGAASGQSANAAEGSGSGASVAGSNVSARPIGRLNSGESPGGIGVSEGQGVGTVGGIGAAVGNATGIGTTSGNAAVSGLSGIASTVSGLATPGLAGLANSQNNTQAANAFAAGIATAVGGPIAGIVVGYLMSQVNGNGNDAPADDGPEGSVSVEGLSPVDGMSPAENAAATAAAEANAANTSGSNSNANAGGDSGGVGEGSGVGAGGATGGSTSGEGGDGGGNYKSGGPVDGPGTGTSDSILARLSDGEFVIPADVVEAKGEDFFNSLIRQYHTPAAQQKTGKGK